MQAFTGVVSLAEKYLVPAFNIVVSAVIKVANGISMILKPALDYLSDTFGNNGLAGTAKFLDDVLNAVFPIFAGGIRAVINIFDSLYQGIQAVITPFNELVSKIFGVSDSTTSFSDIIIDISGTLGLVIQYLSVGIRAAILAFDGLWLGIQGVIEPFKELMNKIFGVSDSAGGFTDILIDAGEIAGKIFQYLGVVINGVIVVLDGLWNGISAIFQPLKELGQKVLGLISSIFGASEGTDGFVTIVMGAGRFLGDLFQTIGKAIGVVIKVIDIALTPIFFILSGAMQFVIGTFKILYAGIKIIIDVFAKLMDIIQDVGTFFGGLMDMILFAVGKLTKGLAGINEDEYKAREKKREELKADRAVERKNRDDTSKQSGKEADARDAKIAADLKAGLAQTEANAKNQKAAAQVQIGNYKAELPARLAAQKAAANADARRFAEQKVTHNQLTGAAQREAAAKEAAIKAQEKLLDYTAGPEALLKQFSDKEGGAVEIGIKKGEVNKEKAEADKELAAAKTGAEKRAAAEKIEAAEAKLKALNEAEALAKQRTGSGPSSAAPASSASADSTRKSIEADAEKKKLEEAAAKKKIDEEAAAKKKAEEDANKKKEEEKNKKPESAETLLAELNTKMATLLKYTFTVAHNTNETVTATRGLNKNLYKA